MAISGNSSKTWAIGDIHGANRAWYKYYKDRISIIKTIR